MKLNTDKMTIKSRIDVLLVEKGIFPSRARAQAEVMAGNVIVNGQVVLKSSAFVSKESQIEIKAKSHYVSRGALKLIKALEEFKIDVEGKVCLDAGASTGGFTQVLLEHDAKKVIAVDVGYGQFDYNLRKDRRVELIERTNIRYLDPRQVEPVELVVADLSFISIIKVIDKFLLLAAADCEFVFLIKPQFEAGSKLVKKGVIRDPDIHKVVLKHLIEQIQSKGLDLTSITFSPIKGPKGNIEFLVYFKKHGRGIAHLDKVVNKTVEEAYLALGNG